MTPTWASVSSRGRLSMKSVQSKLRSHLQIILTPVPHPTPHGQGLSFLLKCIQEFSHLITMPTRIYLIYITDEGTAMEKVKLTLSPTVSTDQAESGNLPLLQGILAY